ncbi:MAG TPA: hypothetical protein VFN02_12680 [Ktedonobacteraceae bacterium]|nr:hypothetical protein [Ktedonobacteraceae bacterium]
MNYLLAIKRAEDKCRGRFIVPIADLSAHASPPDSTRRDSPLEPTTGADKSAMGAVNRPLRRSLAYT